MSGGKPDSELCGELERTSASGYGFPGIGEGSVEIVLTKKKSVDEAVKIEAMEVCNGQVGSKENMTCSWKHESKTCSWILNM